MLVNDPIHLFWSILSVIDTCSYNPANLFVPILEQLTINEYTVKDLFSFCKEILDEDPNLFMASFDIHSMFADMPLEETINICVDLVFH